jgi:hypothetical protein
MGGGGCPSRCHGRWVSPEGKGGRERESSVFGESHRMVGSGPVVGGWWPASLLLLIGRISGDMMHLLFF